MKMKTNKKGVTLIELIVVLVIIAIGAVLLAPHIGIWLPNYRLRSATRDIASTMRLAQMKAVSNNAEYQVSFDQNAGSYILQRHTGGVWLDDGVKQTLPTGITIKAISFSGTPNIAQFNPNSTSSSGSITLQNTKKTERKITLTPSTGKIKTE